MHTRFIKILLPAFLFFFLTTIHAHPALTTRPPKYNKTTSRYQNSTRISEIKRCTNLNNSYGYETLAELTFNTLLNNQKYCLKHWNMPNYLVAFVCKSLPLYAAPYTKETHFYLNEQQQFYIPKEIQLLIFNQYPLYNSTAFCAALHYLPDFQHQIERVYNAMTSNSHVCKQLGSGRAYVQQAYHAIEQHKREQYLRQQQEEKKQLEHQQIKNIQLAFKQQEIVLTTVLQEYDQLLTLNTNACQQRMLSRQIAIKQALQQPVYTTKDYALSHKQAALLAHYNIDSNPYTKLLGNQLQHQLHIELLAWLSDAFHHIDYGQQTRQNWLGTFIEAAHTANKLGRCFEPLLILDFAWSAIDSLASCGPPVFESEYLTAMCAAAVHLAKVDKHMLQLCKDGNVKPFINGAVQGITSVASLLRHPIDSFATMAHHLSKIINRLDETPNSLLLGNFEQADKKAVGIVDDFVQFQIDAAHTFVATPEEQVLTQASALTVETLALQGCGKAVSALANKAVTVIKNSEHLEQIANTAQNIVKRVQNACKEAAVERGVTTEGIEVTSAEIAQAEVVGGASFEKIPKYISKTFSYIIADEPAILALAETFKTFNLLQYTQELGFEFVQITEKYLKHFFGIELEEVIKRSGLVKKRIGGFHHDYLETLEKSRKVEIIEKTIHKNGLVKLKINNYGKITEKTLFPPSWNREKCLIKITESLQNVCKTPAFEDGAWVIHGLTTEGIEIRHAIKNIVIISNNLKEIRYEISEN